MNKFFFFKDLDCHYELYFLGIRLRLKHKCDFKYKPANSWGLNTEEERSPKLIVSLTSFPGRMKTIHLTINTLLTQTLKPDELVLWLAEEQFPRKEEELPEELLRLREFGLSIKWCEDLRSYKKLLPSLREHPDDIIITTDDDAYYNEDVVESLYKAYLQDPKNIYARRAVKMAFDENGELQSISTRKYQYRTTPEPTYFNQQIGAGAVLYPPHSLYKDILNVEQIRKTLPTHDDVYFWAMAVLNRTKVSIVSGYESNLYFVEGSQDVGLIHINKKGCSEGISLEDAYKLMIREYPEMLEILKEG